MIRYRDLTEEQKKAICNGCGPKGGKIPVPELFLGEPCNHHDFNYWIGCRVKDRWKADWQLLREGQRLAGWNPLKQAAAMTYYLAVAAFGWTCFYYADKEHDENDLVFLMQERSVSDRLSCC